MLRRWLLPPYWHVNAGNKGYDYINDAVMPLLAVNDVISYIARLFNFTAVMIVEPDAAYNRGRRQNRSGGSNASPDDVIVNGEPIYFSVDLPGPLVQTPDAVYEGLDLPDRLPSVTLATQRQRSAPA